MFSIYKKVKNIIMNVFVNDANEVGLDGVDDVEDETVGKVSSNKVPVDGVSDRAFSAHVCRSGLSSYGKSNFVLPVTFFDIQSNLTHLNQCYPLTIKVVDCDKYPWFYKKIQRSDTHPKETNSVKEIVNISTNNNQCINIDITEKMIDKNEYEDYVSEKKDSIKVKPKDIKKIKKTFRNYKNQQDKMKNKALTELNLSQIDFKRNTGLVGLKIHYQSGCNVFTKINTKKKCNISTKSRHVGKPYSSGPMVNIDLDNYVSTIDKAGNNSVTKCQTEATKNVSNFDSGDKTNIKLNSKYTELPNQKPEASANAAEPVIDTSTLNKYISVVDKALCDVGTDIIPIRSTDQPHKNSDTIIKTCKPAKTSETTVQISTSKLSVNTIDKLGLKKKSTNKNASTITKPLLKSNNKLDPKANLLNKDISENTITPMEKKITTTHLKDKTKIASTTKTSKQPKQEVENVKCNKEQTKIKDNIIINHNKEPNDPIIRSESRSKSPIFSCNVNMATKLPTMNSKLQSKLSQQERNGDLDSRNTDLSKCQPQTNNYIKSKDFMKKDAFNKKVPLLLQNCDKDGRSFSQNSNCGKVNNKNGVTITAMNISKPKNNDVSITLVNEAENGRKKVCLSNSTSTQSTHSEKGIESSLHINANKKMPSVMNQNCLNTSNDINKFNSSLSKSQLMSMQRAQNNICQNSNIHTPPKNDENKLTHNIPIILSGRKKNKKDCLPISGVGFQDVPPSYNNYNINPKNFGPYLQVSHTHLQQNMNLICNANPDYGVNPYWPYRYPPQIPLPPLLPPPPPPPLPIERRENSQVVQMSSMAVGKSIENVVKKINLIARSLPNDIVVIPDDGKNVNNCDRSNIPQNERIPIGKKRIVTKNYVPIQKDTAESHVKLVASKTEMFDELQKEMLKVNYTDTQNSFSRNKSGLNNLKITSKAQETNDTDKKSNSGDGNKQGNSHHDTKKNEYLASGQTDTLALPCRNYKQKAGPLCMKNRTGPFARLQTPPRPQCNQTLPQPHKGYSPPILPIPTFEKSLEMLTRANDAHRQSTHETAAINKSNKTPTKRARLEFFCVDNEEKSLKKISLQDYQNRVARGDDKCIVLKKNTTCKKLRFNQTFEQDLGYDSDATVKL